MSYCCTQKVDQDDLFSDGEDEDWDNEILAYLEFVVNGEQKRCEVVKGENIIGRDLDAQSTTKIIIDDLVSLRLLIT
ncbi:unnamed protein product [Anisakis simplex]|uniref:TMV resistance protein N-like n=1 Tax=Anisakis simplex TaxID=6269 RepID=A0A0M3K800_ANISI|nr:unnamed protein product [Anisakis simplex]